MASFIKNLKNEIVSQKEKGDCCTLSLLYGIVLSAGSISSENGEKFLEITTSSDNLFEKVFEIVERLTGGFATLTTDEESNLNHTTYLIRIPFEFALNLLSTLEIFTNGEYNFAFNEHIIENDCCKSSFLKGVFLATANSSIKYNENGKTNSGYHLEFVLQSEELADVVSGLLAEFGVIERTVYRGNLCVVYLSDYDSVLTLVGVLGANKTYLELENENISRSVNQNVNRQLNFLNANLNKQSEVSAKQILAIREIDDIIGLASLPFELFEVANARLNNPELSLSELIDKLSTPISKSGINHRMRKLIEIHKNLHN